MMPHVLSVEAPSLQHLISGVTIGVVALSILSTLPCSNKDGHEVPAAGRVSSGGVAVRMVPRVEWPSFGTAGADTPGNQWAHSATPVVYLNTPAEQWKARTRWGPRGAVNALSPLLTGGRLANVFHHNRTSSSSSSSSSLSSSSVFGPFFDPTRPFAALASVRPRNPYTADATLSKAAFLQVFNGSWPLSSSSSSSSPSVGDKGAKSPRGKRDFEEQRQRPPKGQKRKPQKQHGDGDLAGVWAYSGSVRDALGPAAEEEFFEPLEPFLQVGDPRKSSVNLWVGQPGATTPCHYDTYHNMYIQLSGSKRFTLYAPSAHGALQTFPFLHPSFAQCQVVVPTTPPPPPPPPPLSTTDRAGEPGSNPFSTPPTTTATTTKTTATPAATASTTAEAQPRSRTVVEMWVADLRAGDVLYIPPAWLHQATATAEKGSAATSVLRHGGGGGGCGVKEEEEEEEEEEGDSDGDADETGDSCRSRRQKRGGRVSDGGGEAARPSASVSVNVWTGDEASDTAVGTLLSLRLPGLLSTPNPSPPRGVSRSHDDDDDDERGLQQQRKRAREGVLLVSTVLRRYFTACVSLTLPQKDSGDGDDSGDDGGGDDDNNEGDNSGHDGDNDGGGDGGGGRSRSKKKRRRKKTLSAAKEFARVFLQDLFLERYKALLASGELPGWRELELAGASPAEEGQKRQKRQEGWQQEMETAAGRGDPATSNSNSNSSVVPRWALDWREVCEESSSSNRRRRRAPNEEWPSQLHLAQIDTFASEAVPLLAGLVTATATTPLLTPPPATATTTGGRPLLNRSSGLLLDEASLAAAMASVEHWARNWVESVALAAVPLETVPLFVAQLSGCIAIDDD